jgi:hypothetical protein
MLCWTLVHLNKQLLSYWFSLASLLISLTIVFTCCRERGQRALEQRLAEKLATVRSSEGASMTQPPQQPQVEEDASDKV